METIEITPLRKKINAVVSIPGSKSYTNRALILATIAGKGTKILDPLVSDDTKAMINCLKALGIKFLVNETFIEVLNNIDDIKGKDVKLDANLSGTTIRFLLALSTLIPGIKTLSGGESLNKRPIGELVDALKQLGAKIEYLEKKGYPPVRVLSSKLKSGTVKINGSISSQFISAILMISPLVGEVNIEIIGNQSSKPFIDMTIDIMEKFGVRVNNLNYKEYMISNGQKYKVQKYTVEGDVSSAAYFFAIAALTKSKVTVKNINPDSKQADMAFLKILEKMGSKVVFRKEEIVVSGRGVKAINLDMEDCPDQVQTLAVLAAFAEGITKIAGVKSLRIKETDRILAIKQELKKMGIKVKSSQNSLTILGGNPRPATFNTYSDHRMAMSFAVAGSLLSGVRINNPDVVNKTFPDFWEKLYSIGVKNTKVSKKNIILIGMRGSGKSIVAKLLSKKLNKQYLELDEILMKKMNMTIARIVKKYGWDFFRDQESKIVKEVAKNSDLVISTGGGVVIRSENIETLKRNGILIFLNASLEKLLQRIENKVGNDPKMPVLTDKKTPKEEISYILAQRDKLYEEAADQIIDTDNLSPNEVADMIVLTIKESR